MAHQFLNLMVSAPPPVDAGMVVRRWHCDKPVALIERLRHHRWLSASGSFQVKLRVARLRLPLPFRERVGVRVGRAVVGGAIRERLKAVSDSDSLRRIAIHPHPSPLPERERGPESDLPFTRSIGWNGPLGIRRSPVSFLSSFQSRLGRGARCEVCRCDHTTLERTRVATETCGQVRPLKFRCTD